MGNALEPLGREVHGVTAASINAYLDAMVEDDLPLQRVDRNGNPNQVAIQSVVASVQAQLPGADAQFIAQTTTNYFFANYRIGMNHPRLNFAARAYTWFSADFNNPVLGILEDDAPSCMEMTCAVLALVFLFLLGIAEVGLLVYLAVEFGVWDALCSFFSWLGDLIAYIFLFLFNLF